MGWSHWLRVPRDEFIIHLIHRCKVVHSRNEHVDLDGILQAATGLFEDGLYVFECLSLDASYQLDRFSCMKSDAELTVRSLTVPSTILEVLGSMPMLPEQ